MPRRLLYAHSPRSLVEHSVGIDDVPQKFRKGAILPAEVHARTMCSLPATGWIVVGRSEEIREDLACKRCP